MKFIKELQKAIIQHLWIKYKERIERYLWYGDTIK